jgi:DNA-directed RNA polymerase specialized sigma subunit
MKNYWLDKKKVTLANFERAIFNFKTATTLQRSKSEVTIELHKCFTVLVKAVIEYGKFENLDKDDMLQEGLMVCFDKLSRYDATKSKAFNYFTTCVLGHFRQLYRASRNYKELKERYEEFLARKKGE